MRIKKYIYYSFLLCVFVTSCQSSQKPVKKPNIIFLLTDDQRWDAMGAMGNEVIQTPNMDQLAHQGILFSNANVTTSICCTSRSSILTGQYASRHGINDFVTDLSDEALSQTYPMLLKHQAGYKVGFVGKYGVGFKHQPADQYDYWGCEHKHQPDYENEDAEGNYLHHTDMMSQHISTFLDQYAQGDAPFCLSVSFKAPHSQDQDPRQFIYHPRYKELYAEVDFPLPETADSSFYYMYPDDFRNRVVRKKHKKNEARKRWDIRFSSEEKYQESVRSYYRLITGVDDAMGKMMAQLKALGIDDNTIVIFMGDNGFYLGEHGLAGKWFPHQESLKVPFFIFDPRREQSETVDDFTFNIDIAPTILSLAGVPIPEQMQGINVMELLGPTPPQREKFYYEHKLNIPTIPKSEAVVSKTYKYIRYPELKVPFEELYDLKKDPHEKHNLIHNAAYARVLDELKRDMEVMSKNVK